MTESGEAKTFGLGHEETEAERLAAPRTTFARQFERVLTWITEPLGVLLVVVEIVIVSVGVTSRYLFNHPLIWTDELATLLLSWLAMIGSVIALRRGQHMRLGLFFNLVGPSVQRWFEAISAATVTAFLLVILWPSYQRFDAQMDILSVGLNIPDGYRSAAFVAGIALMSAVSFLRLVERSSPKHIAGALVAIAAVVAIMWIAKPFLLAMGNYNLLIFFFFLMAVVIAMGIPIAFAMGAVTLLYLILMTRVPLQVFVGRVDEGISHFILLSIPLFIILGLLIEVAGVARALLGFIGSLLGHVRGGYNYVLLGAMFLVSGISGSKTADMAAVAPGLVPQMKRQGSHPGELGALLSASSAMTETIPPSLVLIILGSVAGVSIGALFTGGIIPAIVCTLAIVLVTWWRSRAMATGLTPRASWSEVGRTALIALPALALPVLIRSAVVEGVATATEVATIGIIYTLIFGPIFYARFGWRDLYPILLATASISGLVFMILGAATALAWALTQSGFARQLVLAMTSVPGGATGFLMISVVGFIILGALLEGIPALIVFGPLMFPASRALGIHDVHYSFVIIIAMGIGLFSPFGTGFYAACAIAGVPSEAAIFRVVPYLIVLFIALVFIAIFPWLSTGLL